MEYLLTLIALHHEPLSYFFNVHFMILFGDVRRPVPDCGIAPYVKSKMNSAPGRDSGVGGWFLLGAAQPRSEWVLRTENGAASAAKI